MATGLLEYGLDTNYGNAIYVKYRGTPENKPNISFWQQIELSGLTAGTTYHYRITAKDYRGNLTVSPDYTFTTKQKITYHVCVLF